jgi:hypothetical protein
MEQQLAQLTTQEQYLKNELAAFGAIHEMRLLDNWEKIAVEYLANLHAGLGSLNETPTTDEEKKGRFQLKREMVLMLVEKVLIKEERKMEVIFKLDVLSLLGLHIDNTSNGNGGSNINSKLAQNKLVGTYTRKQSCLLRRRYAVCV